MKATIVIFVTIITAVYFFANWYIFSRGMKALDSTQFQSIFKWVFWVFVISFPVGQFLERGNPTEWARVVSLVGSLYLVVLLYTFLQLVLVDVVRLFDSWWHFVPAFLKQGPVLFSVVAIVSLGLLMGGYYNAAHPVLKQVEVKIDKDIEGGSIKAVLLTDIHKGVIIQNGRIRRMVERVKEIDPDIVLFAGDLVDHNPTPVIKNRMGEDYRMLTPKLGMYAVTGNHEYIGNAATSVAYLSEVGIQYVRDTAIEVGGVLTIAGRDDRDKPRYGDGTNRKDLNEILNGVNTELPLLLLDHQPVDYDKAKELGVDLMLSGHTHKGQLWPFGYITSAIYENHYGLMKKGQSYFYTSSGYGTWGPPVRVGNRPEIVEITITGR